QLERTHDTVVAADRAATKGKWSYDTGDVIAELRVSRRPLAKTRLIIPPSLSSASCPWTSPDHQPVGRPFSVEVAYPRMPLGLQLRIQRHWFSSQQHEYHLALGQCLQAGQNSNSTIGNVQLGAVEIAAGIGPRIWII